MKSLDEAIKECEEQAGELIILASWLKELKQFKNENEKNGECRHCKHRAKGENESPCNICKNNYINMYERGIEE